MKDFYDEPVQVLFIEEDQIKDYGIDACVCGGIAFHDSVICADCGCAIPLSNILYLEEIDWASVYNDLVGDSITSRTDVFQDLIKKFVAEKEEAAE